VIKKKDPNQKNKEIWEDYIKNPSDIYDKDKDQSLESSTNKRYKFDLHGFNLNDANIKVKKIIEHCVKNKYEEILLITGKGIHSTNEQDIYISKDLGKLKHSVPEYIKTNDEVNQYIVSINDADKKDGGEGAIIIKLKNL
tara:strand:- start:304 stop:723 length:420 start_codon:yes stop_codon:yes gene_type:complete